MEKKKAKNKKTLPGKTQSKSAKAAKNLTKKQNTEKKKMSKNARILTTCVCVFLSLVLIFGIVFGIIIAVREAKAVVKVGSVAVSEGECRVLASYYKYNYLSDLRAEGYAAADSDTFWQSKHKNGMTQGELYEKNLKSYIASVAAASNLYYTLTTLTEGDERYIESKTEAFISYYGSEERFNSLVEKYGFDFEDFEKAMKLTYTAELAYYLLYGNGGEALKEGGAENIVRCDEYLMDYARVKMIFLAKERVFEKDESGQTVERELNPQEILDREKMTAVFKEAVANGNFVELTIDEYLSDSENPNDGDREMGLKGYYFSPTAEQTASFALERPEIVAAAFDMTTGEARYLELSDAHVFLYRADPVSRAYTDEDNPFFSDFFKNAAEEFFAEEIEELSAEVEFKDSYFDIDFLSIPTNSKFFVTSWN